MFVETLFDSFRLAKGILKDQKCVHMRFKGFSSSFIKKKKKNNTK